MSRLKNKKTIKTRILMLILMLLSKMLVNRQRINRTFNKKTYNQAKIDYNNTYIYNIIIIKFYTNINLENVNNTYKYNIIQKY